VTQSVLAGPPRVRANEPASTRARLRGLRGEGRREPRTRAADEKLAQGEAKELDGRRGRLAAADFRGGQAMMPLAREQSGRIDALRADALDPRGGVVVREFERADRSQEPCDVFC